MTVTHVRHSGESRKRQFAEGNPGPQAQFCLTLDHRDKNAIDFGGRTPLQYPFTPASDMAGTVVEIGAGAERFKIGDQVISNFLPEWIDGRRSENARAPPYRSLGGAFPGVLADHRRCRGTANVRNFDRPVQRETWLPCSAGTIQPFWMPWRFVLVP